MPKINSKLKGDNFERFVARKFQRWFPNAKRGDQCRDGADSPDVLLSDTRPDYYVECKNLKEEPSTKIYSKWRQEYNRKRNIWCKRHEYAKMPVIIVYKYNYEPLMVLVAIDCHIPWPVYQEAMDKKYNKE